MGGVLLAALAAWAVVFARMPDVDGTLPAYLALWLTMTAAMMLPSAVPMVAVASALGARVPALVGGYLVSWTVFGLAAYGLARVLGDPGERVAGPVLAAAGLYQLSPLKHACLRWCRAPVAFLRRYGRDSSFATGIVHGGFCIGCCAGLMLALFALGLMSLAWTAVVAAVILAEKVAPQGGRVAAPSSFLLVGAGVWVAL